MDGDKRLSCYPWFSILFSLASSPLTTLHWPFSFHSFISTDFIRYKRFLLARRSFPHFYGGVFLALWERNSFLFIYPIGPKMDSGGAFFAPLWRRDVFFLHWVLFTIESILTTVTNGMKTLLGIRVLNRPPRSAMASGRAESGM
jgi:hypothetical protein